VTDEGGTHSGLQLMGQMMGRKPKPLQKRELCMRKLSRKKRRAKTGSNVAIGMSGDYGVGAAQQWIHAEAPLSLLGSSDLTRGREASAAPTRDAEGGRGRMGRNPRRGSNVERRGPGPLPGFNRTPNGSGNGSAGGFVHIQRMCLRKGRRGWEEHSFDDPNLVAAFSLKPRYIVIGRRGVLRLGPGASKRIRPMGFTHNVEDRGPIRQHAWAGVGERKVWDIYADGHGGHVHMSDSGNGMDDLH